MASGGKRPGAGRKKGSKASHTLQAEAGRAFVVATIARHLKPLLAAMVEKAKEGNVQAFSELMDRGWGRPAQAMELTGKDGQQLAITLVKYGGEATP